MIGVNDQGDEISTLSDARQLASFAAVLDNLELADD
jgi:hypothetical protein